MLIIRLTPVLETRYGRNGCAFQRQTPVVWISKTSFYVATIYTPE
jgi:hypothetical protein